MSLILTHGRPSAPQFGFADFARSIGDVFAHFGNARRAAAEFERLSRRSHASLAAEGLTREDLPSVVRERYFG